MSLHHLERIDGNGVDFGVILPDCDICALGKRHQLTHPKTTEHKARRAFQLAVTD